MLKWFFSKNSKVDDALVLTGETILENKEINRWITLIRDEINTNDEIWKEYHLVLICNFARYVQAIPYSTGQYNSKYGLLTYYLASLLFGLRYTKGEPLIYNNDPREVNRLAEIYKFGYMVSIFLYGLNRLTNELAVKCRGDIWNFYRTPLPLGVEYDFRFLDFNEVLTDKKCVFSFMQKIVSKKGFDWLMTNPKLLSEVFCVFDLETSGGRIKPVIDLSLQQTLVGSIKQSKAVISDASTVTPILDNKVSEITSSTNKNGNIHQNEASQTELAITPLVRDIGATFIEWVKVGLKGRILPYNRPDSMIFHVSDGILLLVPDIFRKFDKDCDLKLELHQDYPGLPKEDIIANEIEKLNLHFVTSNNERFFTYRDGANDRKLGFLIRSEVFPQLFRTKIMNEMISTDSSEAI